MHSIKRKAAVAAGSLAVAVGISLFGAGAASAGDFTPREGVIGDGSLQACQTYGNTMAQQGALTGYTCTKLSNGKYYFNWY
ncbi:hypothetical protein ITI46_01120 [Streptomyces oryzae]|uniref:Uncharacterized protein n=1 Tax=Streptomyces oryzae TaxID=1434886 RepID=A0ABS3X4M5_9ACTN|nr:hypothetical protein [Streptomyces oryzae]MBO8190322.1 hypothetical protein [Streptomyces oryzae]